MVDGEAGPDFKKIADFRRDSGEGIHNACSRFVVLCRELKLFSQAIVAIDGSKFKAVNNRGRNFTEVKIDRFQQQIAHSIQRYLDALETADRTRSVGVEVKTERLQRLNQRFIALAHRAITVDGAASVGIAHLRRPEERLD